MNQMTDGEKLVLSFLVALTVPWAIALIANIWINNPFMVLAIGIALSVYTLYLGFQKNGDLENAVGGIFGQMTDWVIPSGISWWFPWPFGEVLHKTIIGKMEIDHTRSSKKQATHVETSDGAQVEVSFYCLFKIVNLRTWVSVEDPRKALDAIMDRCVRWFVSYWPVVGDEGITNVKEAFSLYLMGKPVQGPKNADGSDGKVLKIERFAEELLRDLGVEIKSARVDDVNPPESIVKAHEAAAREDAEAARERKNVAARMEQAKSVKDQLPGLSDQEVFHGVLAMAGEIEIIDVRGGGDFSKGAAIGRSTNQKGKKSGTTQPK